MIGLGAILGAATGLGSIFGGAGKGAADERRNQYLAQSQNYGTQQGAILNLLQQREAATRDRADRALTSPAVRAKQAVIAQMLSNYTPQTVSGLPAGVSVPQTSGGGLAALMSSPQAKAALEQLTRQALLAQLTGSDVPAMPDQSGAMLAPPQMAKPGKFESIAGAIGLGGGILGALGPLLQRRSGSAPGGSGSVNFGYNQF